MKLPYIVYKLSDRMIRTNLATFANKGHAEDYAEMCEEENDDESTEIIVSRSEAQDDL